MCYGKMPWNYEALWILCFVSAESGITFGNEKSTGFELLAGKAYSFESYTCSYDVVHITGMHVRMLCALLRITYSYV
jgi:hypothetical protein